MSSRRRLDPGEERRFRKYYRKRIRKFIETFLKIQTKDQKLVPLRLNEAQKYFLRIVMEVMSQNKPVRLVVLKARQMGISTFIEAFLFTMAMLNPDTNCLIVSHSRDSSKRIYRMSEVFLDNLPPEIRPMVSSRTQNLVRFENPDDQSRVDNPGLRSQIQIGTAKNLDLGASFTLHAVHASEVARKGWADPETTMLSITNAVPYLPGTFIAVESTAQGMGGYFYELWQRAMSGKSEWVPVFIPWFIVKEYEMELSEEERGAMLSSLTEEEKYLMSEFSPVMTLEKLAWRRKTIDIECQGKISLFRQEYPSCLVSETRVSTDKGIIPIGGDELHTSTVTESGLILARGCTGTAEIWRLTTASGRRIEGTYNHPVMTDNRGWVLLSDLRADDYVTLRPPMFSSEDSYVRWCPIPGYTSEIRIDEVWAAYLGYYLGDGYFSKTTVSIACDARDEDVVQDVSNILHTIVGNSPTYKHVARVRGRKGCTYVNVSGGPWFREAMVRLGVILQTSYGAHSSGYYVKNLRVPEAIWRAPKAIVAAFLSALFEADGGKRSRSTMVFYTKSVEFARDIQLLVLGFGINVPIVEVSKRAGNGKKYIGYDLVFNAIAFSLFQERIGFRSVRKRTYGRPDAVTGIGRPPKPNTLSDRVLTVENTGRVELVYDLTVEGEHAFSANGILTHNTPEEAFLASGSMVFDPEALTYHSKFIRDGRRGRLIRGTNRNKIGFVEDPSGPLVVFRPPQKGESYVIGADPSEGIAKKRDGGAGDNAAAVVLSNRMEQCAELCGTLDPYEFGDYLDMLGRFYNTALIYPEVSGYGGGFAVTHFLKESYPRLGIWRYWDKVGVAYSESVGFRPDGKSVPILIAKMVREVHRSAGMLLPGDMSDKIEDNKPDEYKISHFQRERHKRKFKLRILSRPLLNEMIGYIVRDNGSIGASGSGKDDRVRALGLAILALEQIPPPENVDPLMKQLAKIPDPGYDSGGLSLDVAERSGYPSWIM